MKKTGFLRGIFSYLLLIGIVVVLISGMNENAALAKIVVSDIYQNIKKNYKKIKPMIE